jgi:hypothetical protein
MNPKSSSPLFSNDDIYTTSTNSKAHPMSQNPSRSSRRLRQLLANKSPPTNDNPSQILHYLPERKLEDLIQGPESPTTTHVSPSSTKRRRNNSSIQNHNTTDVLLKKLLGRQSPFSPPSIKTESSCSEDSSPGGQTTNKQRSDIFLRVNFLFFIFSYWITHL